MIYRKKLYQLHKNLETEYHSYSQGFISEKEYCSRAKPIDKEIAKLEMATLQDTLVLKGSFLQHALKPKH